MKKSALLPPIVVLTLAILACTLTPTATPLPTSTPVPTLPPAPNYDGVWSGQTEQGLPITVVVQDSRIVRVEFQVIVEGSGWQAHTAQSLPVDAPVEYNGLFVAVQDAEWEIAIGGNFLTFPEHILTGILWARHTDPQGLGVATAQTPFTAYPGEEREV